MPQDDSSTASRLEDSGFFEGFDEVFSPERHGTLTQESLYSLDRPKRQDWKSVNFAPMLYFVRHLDTQAIKIGRSRQPEERLFQLVREFGGRMELIGYLPGGRYEKSIHRQLRKWALGKEWFRDSPEVSRFMQICLIDGLSEAIAYSRELYVESD